jgi:hypothetical protein
MLKRIGKHRIGGLVALREWNDMVRRSTCNDHQRSQLHHLFELFCRTVFSPRDRSGLRERNKRRIFRHSMAPRKCIFPRSSGDILLECGMDMLLWPCHWAHEVLGNSDH